MRTGIWSVVTRNFPKRREKKINLYLIKKKMKYKVIYKDGAIGEIETDETKQRLEQHAHIVTVELLDEQAVVEPFVEVVVEAQPDPVAEVVAEPIVEVATEPVAPEPEIVPEVVA